MPEQLVLNQALVLFEDNLSELRADLVAGADILVLTYSPAKQLDVDKLPITATAIRQHVNYLELTEKLTPIINVVKRIDSYRHYKAHPAQADAVTDMDIERARNVEADWFIQQANLSTRRPHKGICPFHNDSTASLMLMKSKRTGKPYLKCFPCGEAWDSIGFIMCYNKLNFMEAVRYINNQ